MKIKYFILGVIVGAFLMHIATKPKPIEIVPSVAGQKLVLTESD